MFCKGSVKSSISFELSEGLLNEIKNSPWIYKTNEIVFKYIKHFQLYWIRAKLSANIMVDEYRVIPFHFSPLKRETKSLPNVIAFYIGDLLSTYFYE